MSTSSPTIPADVAAHVLFHFGHRGIPAGDWTASLITLIDSADLTNLARFGAAITAMKYDPDGAQLLKDIAAGRCTRCKNDDGPITPSGRCEPCAAPMPLDGVA